jgi:hypothetical protein
VINERLFKIINLRLKTSLEKCVFHPYGSEIWIFDDNEMNWLMILNSQGQLSYNKKFFNDLFACFSLRDREYQPYLKLWIEKLFQIPLRSLRRTSGMDYLVESMFNDKKKNKVWEIYNRFDFGFDIVKKYLELKKNNDKVRLELFML